MHGQFYITEQVQQDIETKNNINAMEILPPPPPLKKKIVEVPSWFPNAVLP